MDIKEIEKWYTTRSPQSFFALYRKIQGTQEEQLLLESTGTQNISEAVYLYFSKKAKGICGNTSCDNYTNFISHKKGYADYCSKGCKTQHEHSIGTFDYKKSTTTFRARYGKGTNGHKDLQSKIKKTNIERFGAEHFMKSKVFHEIYLQTIKEKYTVDNIAKHHKVKEKTNQTNNKIYGKDWPIQNKKILKKARNNYIASIIEKYGVKNVFNLPEVQSKSRKNSFRSGIYKELNYQATYELDFLVKCNELGILKNITDNTPIISYDYNGIEKKYYPDFFIEEHNLIVEIKSQWWYETELEKNRCKQSSAIDKGYNMIFIIDKNYDEFIDTYYPTNNLS